MSTQTKQEARWYVGKTGNHQGLVIEERTGRQVAVSYDKQDGPLLAAAPELVAALRETEAALTVAQSYWHAGRAGRDPDLAKVELQSWHAAINHARAALAKAEGKE